MQDSTKPSCQACCLLIHSSDAAQSAKAPCKQHFRSTDMVNTCGQNMWSRQQCYWTVADRLCLIGSLAQSNVLNSLCLCVSVCVSACLWPHVLVCMFVSVYLYVCSNRAPMHDARRLGCMQGRQVRHLLGTGRFLEQPNVSVTLDHRCVCLDTSVSAVLSMQRQWSVQLQSAAPRPHLFPVAPRPATQARHSTSQERSTTRLSVRHPILAFVQKLELFLLLLKN